MDDPNKHGASDYISSKTQTNSPNIQKTQNVDLKPYFLHIIGTCINLKHRNNKSLSLSLSINRTKLQCQSHGQQSDGDKFVHIQIEICHTGASMNPSFITKHEKRNTYWESRHVEVLSLSISILHPILKLL